MTTGEDEKDETELIEMENGKEDAEPQLIVEEGTVGVDITLDVRKRTYDNEDGEGDSDDDEKDDPMNHSWEDTYEQEI